MEDKNRSVGRKEYFDQLIKFYKQHVQKTAFTDLYDDLYQSISQVLKLSGKDAVYAVLYEVSEQERFSVVDFRSKNLKKEAVMNFLKAIPLFLMPDEKPIIMDQKEVEASGIEAENIPRQLFAVPLAQDYALRGYILVLAYEDPVDMKRLSQHSIDYLMMLSTALINIRQKTYYENRIEYLTLNDNLTNLPNRNYFYEFVVNVIQQANITNARFMLLVANINGLKHINNSLGLNYGDMILKETAARLSSVFNDGRMLISRLTGDDFTVIAPLDGDHSIDDYCQAILNQSKAPILIEDNQLFITMSIGVSIYPSHGETVEALLKNADNAKMASKSDGKNAYKVYEETMSELNEKQLFLNNNLPVAISEDQFELYFQSQVLIESMKIISVEALIRWIHPTRGIIPPFEFIPYADENNYGIAIDTIVLHKACQTILEWKEKGFNISIGVNISPQHFKNGLILGTLDKVLAQYAISDTSMLKIELLESLMLDDFEMTVNVINGLKQRGLTVALDDFGSGYSSLEYVTKLPLDIIKIDRSFTMNLEKNPRNEIILKTIMTLAKAMDLKVIAEGVETEMQLEFLKSIGCDIAQGYLINKPFPKPDTEKLIIQYNGSVGS